MSYYPIFLSVSGRRCVVVGGGQVALRKVTALIEREADVVVISPDFCSELNELAIDGKITVIRRHYQPDDLHEVFLAITTTDNSDINSEVAKEGQKRGVLVNIVDNAEESDFILPSSLRRGGVTIAISTSGMSPALARKIRTKLERDFGNEYESLALLTEEVRAEIRKQDIKVSGDEWQKALDLDLMIDLIKKGDKERAKAVLLDNLKELQK
ncbi:bifunctional precorrin-2 dehydrogenase/sirohydrochlorin ferrochelatase [Chloroflexota bacterium]